MNHFSPRLIVPRRTPTSAGIRAERERRRLERERVETARNAEAIRSRCQSLYAFVVEFWRVLEPTAEFKGGWALQAMCQHLEAVTDGRIQYLLINVPPGMMKSLLVAVFWPAWEWGPRDLASNRFLSSGFSRKNVIRDNNKMRRLVESEKYQTLWGDKVKPAAKWGEETFENTAQGVREGRPFIAMTGGRGDRVVIDDPHSVDSAESDVQRQAVIQTFRESIPDRLNDMTKSAIVIIMQRLHADDVSGTILTLGLPYVILSLPMEFEAERIDESGRRSGGPCRTYIDGELFFEDPRTVDGELLFEERFPRERLEALKRVKGSYAYNGQYQQRPTAREGGLFKRAWFTGKIVTTAPDRARARVRAWDRAGTKEEAGKSPDYSAGVRMSRDGPDYYVEHVARFQQTPGEVRRLILGYAETDPFPTVLRLPQEPAQAGKDQAERDVEAFAGHPVVIKPIDRVNKEARATPMAIQCEYGHVYLVNGGPLDEVRASWIDEFLDELCAFPTGSNDDQVDAAADAFDELAGANTKPFESHSAGARAIPAGLERDSRYNFGDTEAGQVGSGSGLPY